MSDKEMLYEAIKRDEELREEIRSEGLEEGYAEVCQYMEIQLEKIPDITARDLIENCCRWFGVGDFA